MGDCGIGCLSGEAHDIRPAGVEAQRLRSKDCIIVGQDTDGMTQPMSVIALGNFVEKPFFVGSRTSISSPSVRWSGGSWVLNSVTLTPQQEVIWLSATAILVR